VIVFNLKQKGVWRRNPPCAWRRNKEYLLNSIHCTVRFLLPDLRINSA